MKLFELTEGYWKNIDIARQEKRLQAPVSKPAAQKFHVLINGKVWKKDGAPVEFGSQGAAQRSADTIRLKYNKATQVVPVKS